MPLTELKCPVCNVLSVFETSDAVKSRRLYCSTNECSKAYPAHDWLKHNGTSAAKIRREMKADIKKRDEEIARQRAVLSASIKKKKFISNYIINFMATVDANRVCLYSGKVINPCTYTLALKHAERAYEQYIKEITQDV